MTFCICANRALIRASRSRMHTLLFFLLQRESVARASSNTVNATDPALLSLVSRLQIRECARALRYPRSATGPMLVASSPSSRSLDEIAPRTTDNPVSLVLRAECLPMSLRITMTGERTMTLFVYEEERLRRLTGVIAPLPDRRKNPPQDYSLFLVATSEVGRSVFWLNGAHEVQRSSRRTIVAIFVCRSRTRASANSDFPFIKLGRHSLMLTVYFR